MSESLLSRDVRFADTTRSSAAATAHLYLTRDTGHAHAPVLASRIPSESPGESASNPEADSPGLFSRNVRDEAALALRWWHYTPDSANPSA